MYCIYCGTQISSDDVVREQLLGINIDNIEGTAVEVERYVTSATCDSCGTKTSHELNCSDDLFNLEFLIYDNIEQEDTG